MRPAALFLCAWGLALFTGCKDPEPVDPAAAIVATAYGETLTVGDLLAEMPTRLSVADSAVWADRLIADVVFIAEAELVPGLAGGARGI